MHAAPSLEETVLDAVQEGFRLNAVKLPTLPEVTLRVREVAADPDAGVEELAAEIVRDAALTARLIRIANSPMLRGRVEVRTLSQAVTRLGFYYVRDLSTALALEHTFAPRCEVAKQLMDRIGRRSREIAALSHVLARHCTALPPEQALLAGLMHFVGALPLLVALHEHDAGGVDPDELFSLIERRHSGIGSTLLRHWRFPEDIASVPATYRGDRDGDGAADYADVVTVADMLCQPRERVPDLAEVHAARRLGLGSADDFYNCDAMQIDLQRSAGLLN